jgi:rod shape-determining protein MreD
MLPFDAAKIVVLVFVAAIAQVSIFSSVHILGGTPDVLLLTLVAVALLRGSVHGAVAGFGGGLVVDTANLGTLGVTSLLLTLAGYWIGRYGETAGRDRTHAPFLSVAVVTFVYAVGALALHFLLGEPAPARVVLLDTLFSNILLNLILAWPVYTLARRLLPLHAAERGQEVHLLG